MAYAIYVNHPDSDQRLAEDFMAWNFWSKEHAPWTGIGVHTVADVLRRLATVSGTKDIRDNLDYGGSLTAHESRRVLTLAADLLNEEERRVFEFAAEAGYPLRVEYTNAIGVAMHASDLDRGPLGAEPPDPDPTSDAVDLGAELAAFYAPVPPLGAEPSQPVQGLPRGYPLFFPREEQAVLRFEAQPRPLVYLQGYPGGGWYPMEDDGSIDDSPESYIPDQVIQERLANDGRDGAPREFRLLHPPAQR